MTRTFIAMLLSAAMFSGVSAQDPANFHLIYGNRGGSPLMVSIGSIIEVPVWGATDPTPGNPDSVCFMNNPLASNDSIIVARLGDAFPYDCDIVSMPEQDCPIPGYTSQAMFRREICGCFYTLGDTVQIGTFLMRTANDSGLVGQTLHPFIQGCGGPLWGMVDGVRGVIPIQTYGATYFTTCRAVAGDANNDQIYNGVDISFSVNFFKGFGPEPPAEYDCPPHGLLHAAADMNGSCVFNGIDIIYGVNSLRGRGPAPRRCQDCR
jgi:hypothetical protein